MTAHLHLRITPAKKERYAELAAEKWIVQSLDALADDTHKKISITSMC